MRAKIIRARLYWIAICAAVLATVALEKGYNEPCVLLLAVAIATHISAIADEVAERMVERQRLERGNANLYVISAKL